MVPTILQKLPNWLGYQRTRTREAIEFKYNLYNSSVDYNQSVQDHLPGWLKLKFWQTSFMFPFLTGVCLLPPIIASFCLLRFVFVFAFGFVSLFISLFYFFFLCFFFQKCLSFAAHYIRLLFAGVCFFLVNYCLIYCYDVFQTHSFCITSFRGIGAAMCVLLVR